MTDDVEKLIERLVHVAADDQDIEFRLMREAAAMLRSLQDKLTAQQAETIRVHNDRSRQIEALRAKLERAREGFEKIANFENSRGCSWDASIARATLEELK